MIRKLLLFVRSLFLLFPNSSKEKSFTLSLRLICLGMFFVLNFTAAQTKTWTGSSSSNWNTNGNWSPSGVPDNTYDVVIPSGTSNSPVINANATAKSLNISGILTIGNNNNDRTITVSGNITINTGGQFITAGDGGNVLNVTGNIVSSGTFNMNNGGGATATTVLNGANQSFNVTNFYALTLSGSGTKTFTSTGATTIANALTINSGIIANLGTQTHTANTLILGSTQALPGSWGSSSSPATNKSDAYFAATTGQINVSSSTCANFSSVLQIINVSLNTLSKTSSGTGGYEDFTTDTPTKITQGKSYALTVRGNTGGDQNVYYSAFFDWNNDGDFDDAGEYSQIGTIRNSVGTTADGKAASVYITVPSIVTGDIKMRIIGRLTGYNNTPCAISGSTGQMEDYKVTIQSGCSGTAGAPVSSASTVCPNVPFTISLPSSTLTDGATYVWQTSPDNATWSNATPAPITFFGTEAFNSLPTNTNLYGNATITANQLLLTPATNSLSGAWVIQTTPGTNMDAFTVNFDYQIPSGGTGADGFSLSYAGDITSDAAGGESGQGSGIIVQFDTYDNEGVAVGSRVRVLYAGNVLFNSAIDVPPLRPTTGNTPVVLTVDSKGKLTLRINGSVVVSDLSLPAAYLSANKSTWKYKFAARTGGSNDNHIIDNLLIRYQDVTNSNSTFSTTQTAKTYYRVQVTCGTTTTTTSVLVDMSTAAITTQPTTPAAVCSGTGVRTISVAATGSGLTYSWRLAGNPVTNGGVISGQGTNTLTLTNPTAANAGNYTVVVGDVCTTSVTSNAVTLTVNPLPTPTFTASPAATICSDTDVTYTTQPTQTNYIWTVPGTLGTDYSITSGGIGTGSNTVTLKWLTAGSKTVSVNYTNSNGCTATAATTNTTNVNLRPIPTFSPTPVTSICSNTDITYTTQTGQTNYIWTVSGTLSTDYTITTGGIGTGSNTVTLKWLTAGSKTVTVNYTNASNCNGASAASAATTVNLRPTPTFTSPPGAATCSNTDVTYATQSGMSNYLWTVPGTLGTDYTITTGGTGTTSNTVTLKWLTAGSKTVSINYTDTNSCTATAAVSSTTTVNLRPTPTFSPTPVTSICSNTDITYTTQTDQSNYIWTVPGTLGTDYTITTGGIGTGSNTVTLKWLTGGSKTVTVNYTNASSCNGASAASAATTVNLRPTPTFTSSPGAATCSNTDITYTTQATQSNYVWTVPGTLGTDYSITSGGIGTGSNTVTLKWLTAGSKTVSVNYTDTNSCTATAAVSSTTTVNLRPTPTFSPTPAATICSNTDITYTTQASQTNYIWTVPGTLGTDYTITTGGIGTGNNTVTLKWLTAGSKTVTVNYTNASSCNGTSAASATTTVNLRPTPTFTTSPGAATCSNTDVTYTTQTTQSNYVWTVPGTLGTDYSITSGGTGTGSNTVTLKWLTAGSKTVSVNYTDTNSCTATTAVSSTTTVNLRPTPTFIVSPGATTCASSDVTYTTQTGQSNYIWTVPGTLGTDYTITSGGIGTGSNTVTLKWLTAGSKTVSVNYTDISSCTATSATSVTTTVNALPTITTHPQAIAVCEGKNHIFTIVTSAGSPSYQWQYSPDNATWTNTNGAAGVTGHTTASLNVPNIPLSYSGYYVRCIITVGTCSSTSNSALLTVNPTPTAPTASVTTQPTCAAPTATITVSSPAPAVGITYSIDGTTYTNTTGIFTGVTTGSSYNVTTKNSSGCESPITVVSVNAYAGKTWNGSVSTNWNVAGNWTPSGVPTVNDCVVIPDLTSITNKPEIIGTNTEFKAHSINLNNNSSFIVRSTNTLTVTNAVTVNTGSTLTFENNASLVQTTNAVNSGNITYLRSTTPINRYDYVYWSVPVTATPGITLHDLSPTTLADKYQSFNPTSGWVISYNGTQVMTPGQGYIVRGPQENVSAAVFQASFTGVPNNGDFTITPVATKWHLIGNPYPSAISANKLITDAGTGALYFWTHTNQPDENTSGNETYNYDPDDYSVYTLSGSTGTSNGPPASGKIAAGQGFFFKASTGSDVVFTNSMRIPGDNSQFFKTAGDIERNRVWLNMKNTTGLFKQVLVGYIEGATNSWDQNYDAATLNGNTYVDFYSINDAKKLTIQGRELPFEDTDLVPLGYKTAVAGEFTIAIDHTDGLLNNQAVYLEDKTNGTIYDLKAGNYKFTTEIGTFTDRFVLRYNNKTLGTGDFENVKDGLLVSVKDKVIKVTSSKENIKEVAVFDITGKLLYNKKKVGTTEFSISNLQVAEQVLLVKVTLENKAEVTRKIIFK